MVEDSYEISHNLGVHYAPSEMDLEVEGLSRTVDGRTSLTPGTGTGRGRETQGPRQTTFSDDLRRGLSQTGRPTRDHTGCRILLPTTQGRSTSTRVTRRET